MPQAGRVELARPAIRYESRLSETLPFYAESRVHAERTPWTFDVHEGMEVGLLLEGELERVFQDHAQRCLPGDVWLAAIWEVHGYRIVSPHTRTLTFQFLPQFLGDEMLGDTPWFSLFAAPPTQRPRVADDLVRGQLLAIGEELQHEVATRGKGWAEAVRIGLLRMLLLLSREWSPESHGALGKTRSRQLLRLAPALTLVHTRLGQRTSVLEGAGACNLSIRQFSRAFRETMGASFGEFCLRARLAAAAGRLLDSKDSLHAIAAHTGFNDGSHLHRSFRKRYGCTPGAYRKHH